MLRAGPWRSAWAWRYPQRRAKRSGIGGARPGAVRIGEEVGDGAGVPGVIAGGAQEGASAGGGRRGRQAANLQDAVYGTKCRVSRTRHGPPVHGMIARRAKRCLLA